MSDLYFLTKYNGESFLIIERDIKTYTNGNF